MINNLAGQVFFTIIEGNLESIIDLFPLQYEKQREAITSAEQKQQIIMSYKAIVKEQERGNIEASRKQQQENRKGKPIDTTEEHLLVQSGVLTNEEIAPIISSYELLNTLGAYNMGVLRDRIGDDIMIKK